MKKYILILAALLGVQAVFAQWTDPSNWSHKGPFKYGSSAYETGRLDVIAIPPAYNGTTNTTIYVGGSNGGLWKTTNGGTDWTNIPTNYMRYSGIGDMAFTSDGLYLFIADRISTGTYGDRGSGVYKYTISSGAWAQAGTSQAGTLTTSKGERLKNNHLKIHPSDNNTLYLATDAGLFETSNQGGTWTLRASGNFENIAFVPNTGATGGYDVYISGMNTIMKSSDKGINFSAIPTPSPNNPFTSYTNPYLDMTYGGLDTDGTSKILYFQAWVASPATYAIYKYKIPTSGSPTMTFLVADVTHGPEIDRLCIVGNKDMLYYGGTKLTKYKISTNTVYNPVPVPNGTDVALSVGNFPSYYSPGGTQYASMIHPDLHDIKIFDNGTTRKIFVVHDGGFSENTYTTTGTAGVYTNSWTYKNNGLHIATVAGFSGSETDPDVYVTGEQDTKGFVFNEAMTKIAPFQVEPRMVMLDKEKKKNGSGQDVFRVFHNSQLHYPDYYTAEVNFNPSPATISSAYTGLYDCQTGLSYFSPSGTPSTPHSPQRKMFYQDPMRGKQIYALSGGFWQWDEATQKFGAKYKVGKNLSHANPVKRDHPFQAINSMAVSRNNKNKVYLVSDADGDLFASQIYRFTGANIDDSWDQHNDTQWDYITPDLRAAPFNYTLTDAQIIDLSYTSMVMSDWDENTLWVIAWDHSQHTKVVPYPGLKVLKYENGAWSNYSQNIPIEESPQSMVYERGSYDGIYLATDHNIYYRNAFMSQWELYNSNANSVPHTFIHQMEVNYKENTLRAGTYGRGIWKTNLKCPTSPFTSNSCNNCNTSSPYHFWEGTTVTINNATLNTKKQIVRAVTSIDINPETTLDPAGNPNVYYELFIHGCGGLNGNSFRVYQNPNPTGTEEGEEEEEWGSSISAYPNPHTGSFILNTGTSEAKDIYVYNTLGEIVYQLNNTADKELEIDIRTTPKGIYFVRMVSGNKTETIKVVNQ